MFQYLPGLCPLEATRRMHLPMITLKIAFNRGPRKTCECCFDFQSCLYVCKIFLNSTCLICVLCHCSCYIWIYQKEIPFSVDHIFFRVQSSQLRSRNNDSWLMSYQANKKMRPLPTFSTSFSLITNVILSFLLLFP